MGDLTVVFKAIVAPFAGAWIEINGHIDSDGNYTSLPSRERGLKFCNQ